MKLKGQFTIVKRDKDTLDIIEERVVDNIITSNGLYAMMQGLTLGGSSNASAPRFHDAQAGNERKEQGLSNSNPAPRSSSAIYVHETAISPNIFAQQNMPTGQIRGNVQLAPTTYIAGSTGSPITPEILEFSFRFNAPVSARTIRTIFIGRGFGNPASSNLDAFSYAALDTPCPQGTSEILDITYRLQFHDRALDVAGASTTFETTRQQVFGLASTGIPDAYYLFDKQYNWNRIPPSGDYDTLRAIDNGDGNVIEWSRFTDQIKMRSNPTANWTVEQNKGRVLRSIMFGDINQNSGTVPLSSFLTQPATGETFANAPVQPIHNHSEGAVEPFLDVDFLATGSGVMDVDGAAWVEQEWPEFYRVDVIDSGNVGTSSYSFAKRKLLGFDRTSEPAGDPTWNQGRLSLPWMTTVNINTISGAFSDFNNGRGAAAFIGPSPGVFGNMEEYDGDHFILFESSNAGIINLNGGAVSLFSSPFDTGGSPAIQSVSGIQQVAVDDSGSLWVASNAGGLFRIDNPLNVKGGSPETSTTQMTNATHGIPAGSDLNCYGVARGYGGSIWAVFDGALGQTLDGGTSWTLYDDAGSPPEFVYTAFGGITNGNWDQVKYLRIDESSPDNEMILWYRNAGDATSSQLYSVWWSTTTSAVQGPGTAGFINMAYGDTGLAPPAGMRCSRTGSLWIMHGRNISIWAARFGTTTVTLIVTNVENYFNTTFAYDAYGNPYALAVSAATGPGANLPGSTTQFAVYNKQLEGISRVNYGTNFDGRANGPMLALNETTGRAGPFISGAGGFGGMAWEVTENNPVNEITQDNWNGLSTPFEEFVWRRHNFNQEGSPSVWEEGYHFPATDTSGNGFNGIRENFFTEDHAFRGRSSIDISAVATPTGSPQSSTFAGSPLTFTAAFTLSSEDKPGFTQDGSTRQALLSGFDPGRANFTFRWVNDSDELSFYDGASEQSFGVTPTLGGSPNLDVVVLVVSGNTATCYLNGIQLGSPQLTITPQDLSNNMDELELRLGSTAFTPDAVTGQFTRNITDFYLGTMRNVQMWNSAWDATDVTNHNSAPLSVIGSEPIGNLEGRWELNPVGSPAQDLTGLEAKSTHDGFEALDNGLTITFGAGSPLGDFDTTDFYTFGVVDGMLKDNAISYTTNSYLYHLPTTFGFRGIEDTVNSPGVGSPAVATIPAAGGTITEPTLWRASPAKLTSSTGHWPTNRFPGQLGQRDQDTSDNSMTTFQFIDDTGGYFECRPTTNNAEQYFGLTDAPGSAAASWATVIDYGFRTRTDGNYEIRELNVVHGSPASAPYVAGDLFRVTRVGGSPDSIEYRVNNVLVYTSLVAPSADLSGASNFGNDEWATLYDCAMNWNRPENILDLGDSVAFTGKYATDYFAFDSIRVDSSSSGSPVVTTTLTVSGEVLIGSPQVSMVVTDNNFSSLKNLSPAPGEVIVVSDGGLLVFNTADQGSVVSSSLTLITNS